MPPARRCAVALRPFALVPLLFLAFAAGRPGIARAQMCEARLTWCNYGKYYSGTISWSSRLDLTGEVSGSVTQEITATVTRGQVTCSGREDVVKNYKSQRLRHTEQGVIGGAGLLSVEKPRSSPTDKRGTYVITLACPTPERRWQAVDPNGSNSGTEPGEPAQLKGGEYHVTTEEEQASDFALLAGSQTYEHPETDAVNGSSGTVTLKWQLSSRPLVVKAVPGGPYTVARGERLTLDGSKSEGGSLQYTWTFAPKGCPGGVAGSSAAKKDGPTPAVTLLCSADVTLTVSDGSASDSKTVAAVVTPRDWKTPFSHSATEGTVENGGRPVIEGASATNPATGGVKLVGGQNACALDPSAEDHIFHPAATNGSWDNSAYELRQVMDPDGPFDGYWYVGKYELRLERQTLMNKYLLPGAPPLLSTKSFYQANRSAGTPVDAYLAAIRAHEGLGTGTSLGHSGRMKRALATADPARKVEALITNGDRDGLQKNVDAAVRAAEVAICKASSDPLPETWRGRLAFVRVDTGDWITMVNPAVVGGPGYGVPTRCG